MTDIDNKRRDLDQQIAAARNEIKTDKLDITYGELANLYDAKELIIRPVYQRLFRWTPTQKTRFIESILLGFPTPAIFVAENAQGIWELVDGLQRVSTVLEYMGLLKDEQGDKMAAPELVRAGYKPRLPSVEDMAFSDLSLQARLSIKRAGCRVEVIKVGSDPTMKYEVFERLNTGGTVLSAQEVRNCIFRATAPEFVDWVESLATFSPFHDNLCLSELQENTMFDRGLVLRYLTMKNAYEQFEHDVEPFITDFVRQVLEEKKQLDMDQEGHLFKNTFKLIASAMREDSWRHFRDGRHKGPFSVYVFETVSTGVAVNLAHVTTLSADQLKDKIIEFKEHPSFVDNTGAGANIKSKQQSRMCFAHSFFGV